MALTQVTGPYPIFTDLDGSPLDDGYLYIGAANQDPETNPIQVFWDSTLTIPATQPIRTNNGYAWRSGTPGLLYTGGEFSITIRNKRNEFVLYSPVGYGFDPKAASASVVKNDFIGNGVQTNFTLSAAPSTKLATNIFINGVYQEKDSYILTGNVISFLVAPPLSSSIEILTNETGVINGGNANDITYTLTAPGAVGQTVQTRLEQYVSVKDFGAVGDGVVDDTAAILAALTANVGPVQLVNGETYSITGFTVPAGATLFGSATLLLTSGKITLSNNVTLKDFTIDGDSKANADHALYANAISNVTIDGVNFTQIGKSGLDATGVTNLTMVNCTGYEIGDPGIINVTNEGCLVHLLNCSKVTISQNNRIERTYGHAAIFVRENVVDCSVTNNAIYDTFFRGIQVYSSGHGRVLVANNRIYRTGEINNTGSGIACNGIYIVTGNTDPATVLVIGNHVEKCAENGIEALGGCTVIGNVVKITGYLSLATPSKEGIFLAEGAVVKHNTIVDAFAIGIRNYSDFAETNFVIEGNTIVNSGGDGINCQADTAGGSFTNCHVTNNTILSFGGTWGVAFGPTAGGTVGNTNSVSGNIIPATANAVVNGTPRQFGNSWQSTLTGTSVVDPPNLSAGASQQFTVTVTGAATTNTATASFSQKNADIYWTADVTSANTVTVTQFNRGVGAVDLGSGTLTVYVDRS